MKDEGILQSMHQPAGSTLMEEIIFLPEEVEKTL
ncbi:unnamed protein product, partial [Echinostoma caproni]|uniref:Transcriptional regulator n=1 Tax=Echinostoma caproni TaxID=27848 RepID=A0A183A323_9TREM